MCLCRCVRACLRACVCTCVSVCVCVLIACPIPALLLCALQKTLRTSRALHATNQVRQPVSVFAVSCACMLCCVSCVSQSAYTHTHTPTRMYLSPLSSSAALYSFSLCHPWMFAPACHAVDALRLCSWFSATGVRSGATVTATNTEQDTM